MQFLIEAVEGPCRANQQEVFNRKIVEHSKDLLRDFREEKECMLRGFSKSDNTIHLVNDLIALNIKLLNTLIEANDDPQIYEKMGQKISFDLLMEKLEDYYHAFELDQAKYARN